MDLSELQPGVIVTGPNWPEPVEIKKVDVKGEYIHIIGATTLKSQHIDQLIPAEELSRLSISFVATDLSSEPWKIFL
ncbi:MAG: hypothetical protein ACP5UZ_08435, partial [Thermoplasmata archaeon]